VVAVVVSRRKAPSRGAARGFARSRLSIAILRQVLDNTTTHRTERPTCLAELAYFGNHSLRRQATQIISIQRLESIEL